jgi:acyl phosphate:glycerol-3-phosphate acyltransferase
MVSPLLLSLLAFASGAIPFGFLAGKFYGKDLRDEGSKNIGATNTLRVLGKGPGFAVLALDAIKGYLPVMIAQRQAALDPWWVVAVALCAVLGHIYSPWVRFKGGKGVATTLGVLIGLSPMVAAIALSAFFIGAIVTRFISVGSIIGALMQAMLFIFLPTYPLPYKLLGGLIAFFVVFRHRANIQRLRAGTESKFSFSKTKGK